MLYHLDLRAWKRWHQKSGTILVLLCAGISSILIVLSYGAFNQTFDEPAHIAVGMEWLDRGSYSNDEIHPPLARVAVALGPFLGGVRSAGREDIWEEGNEILHSHGLYSRNLALARLGVLPFFLIAAALVWIWARVLFGETAAVFATALFTTLPPILAHSSLATTDMVFTATLLAALLAFVFWLDQPTLRRSLVLGAAGAAALLSKMSAVVFLPACMSVFLLLRWGVEGSATGETVACRRRWLGKVTLSMTVCFVVVWGGYRFTVNSINARNERPHELMDRFFGSHGTLHDLAYYIVEAPYVPAPAWFRGIQEMLYKNQYGHATYVLGKNLGGVGVWYFFPVALAVKSPLPFLILVFFGLAALQRQTRRRKSSSRLMPAGAAATILVICMAGNINIGVRHILPIYPLLAILAGLGAATLWNSARLKHIGLPLVVILLIYQFASCIRIHPDYIAYFNEVARHEPEYFLVDSDLDWGQDLRRLADMLQALRIDEVSIAYFGTADLTRHGLPCVRDLDAYRPTAGWVAVSLTLLKAEDWFSWLEAYEPVATVGHSIRLYYVPNAENVQVPAN
jgi:4-amino-4-deoxy-L-arabinose transferase-like glycosyltransferase